MRNYMSRKEKRIKKYLSEIAEDLEKLLNNEQGLYLISGCGTGKTYYISEYLAKRKNTLVVNFLNVVNRQSYSDIYIEGTSTRYIDGTRSSAINVQQHSSIKDEVLKKFDLVVIDEIQLQYISSDFRCSVVGEPLKDFILKCINLGVKVLLITGTPIAPVDTIYGLAKVKIIKTELTNIDKYTITFAKGLSYRNCIKKIQRFINEGYKVVVKTDLHSKEIEKLAKERNIRTARLYADAYKVNIDTPTKYVVDHQCLPDEYDLFITTKVMVEGVNFNNDEDDKVIVITFVDDIESPMSAMQLASRLRKQHKNLILGYNSDEDFYISKKRIGYSSTLKDEIFLERERILSLFNNICLWKNYFNNAGSCNFIDEVFNESAEDIEVNNELPLKLSELAGMLNDKIRKINKNWRTLEKPFTQYFRLRSSEDENINITDSGEGYYYLSVPAKKGVIKSLLRTMNKKLVDVSDMTDEEIEDFNQVENTCFILTESLKDDASNESLLIDYVRGIEGELFKDKVEQVLKEKVTSVVGGKIVELTKKDENKHIYSHLSIMENYKDSIIRIGDLTRFKCNPFSQNYETVLDTFRRERKDFLIKLDQLKKSLSAKRKVSGSIGGKTTKTITLVNDSIGFKMTFNSSKNCDTYVRETLKFSDSNMKRLRKEEVNGYKRG